MIVLSDETGIALIPAELFENRMQEIMNKISDFHITSSFLYEF